MKPYLQIMNLKPNIRLSLKNVVLFSVIMYAWLTGAVEVSLMPVPSHDSWQFIPGSEFPGAQGKLNLEQEFPLASWDFSNGGRYVGFKPSTKPPAGLQNLKFDLLPDADANVALRVTDHTGHVFQSTTRKLKANQAILLDFPMAGSWESNWGAGNKSSIPAQPLRSFYLVASGNAQKYTSGSLTIRNILGEYDQTSPSMVVSEIFSGTLAGRLVKATWAGSLNPGCLSISVEAGTEPAVLELEFPALPRNQVTRFQLPTEENKNLQYQIPFLNKSGSNPRNNYQVQLRIISPTQKAVVTLQLPGSKSSEINLGSPKSSSEISTSKIGVCVHFNSGANPSGAFKGWHDYERILDQIASGGCKWIRCGVTLKKDDAGKLLQVSDYDVGWLQAAQKRGIDSIILIDMKSSESQEEFLNRIRLTVEATRNYAHVYELGNEPNNFGGWLQKYGGEWNGRLKDKNEHAPWLKAYLAYTNQGAEYLKKIYPEATVIGCGGVAPANFRLLELGVSNAVDGVVDHAYSYSTPPEKIPFGHYNAKRDGITVGDAEGTFAGYIDSYMRKFKDTGRMRSLWITEFGYSNFCASGKNEHKMFAGYSEEAQAVYLTRRLLESLALPITLSCWYDFVDDYSSSSFQQEANFGLVRSDYSPKPSFYAMQRINSLMHGAEPDPGAKVEIIAAPLHKSVIQNLPAKLKDAIASPPTNGIRTYAFTDPASPDERMLAIWSMLPYSREINSRMVSLEISGWTEFDAIPVAIDLISGHTYDIPMDKKDGKLLINSLTLRENPLLIKFFRNNPE